MFYKLQIIFSYSCYEINLSKQEERTLFMYILYINTKGEQEMFIIITESPFSTTPIQIKAKKYQHKWIPWNCPVSVLMMN